jgi:hypothetical protein
MDRLPPEIEVEDQWPESVRYRLPRRALGALKWIAPLLIVLGIGSMAWLVAAIGGIVLGWKMPVPGLFVFVGFPLGFATTGGLLPIWWGLSMLWGRRELVIRGERLYSHERVGLFRWGKSWPVSEIATLRTRGISPDRETAAEWTSGWDALTLSTTAGQQHLLAWGYPHEWLEPLAHALATSCMRAMPEKNRPAIEVGSDYAEAAALAAVESRASLRDSAPIDEDYDHESDRGRRSQPTVASKSSTLTTA